MSGLFPLRPSKHRVQVRAGELQAGPRELDRRHGSDQILGLDWLASLRREKRELLWRRGFHAV
jgi:hypothetical protein